MTKFYSKNFFEKKQNLLNMIGSRGSEKKEDPRKTKNKKRKLKEKRTKKRF